MPNECRLDATNLLSLRMAVTGLAVAAEKAAVAAEKTSADEHAQRIRHTLWATTIAIVLTLSLQVFIAGTVVKAVAKATRVNVQTTLCVASTLVQDPSGLEACIPKEGQR